MKHSLKRRGSPRDDYLTVVTDLNGYVSYTFDHLALVKRAALRVVNGRLVAGHPDVEGGAACGRCGARVWLEPGENGMPLPVEGDGSPHRDECPGTGQLPLLALFECRAAAKRLAGESEPTEAAPHEAGASNALANTATRSCWNILQDAKALLQCYEALTQGGETMPDATLEEAWALLEGVEVVEAQFQIIAPDLFALLGSLDRLHHDLRFVSQMPRAPVPLERNAGALEKEEVE